MSDPESGRLYQPRATLLIKRRTEAMKTQGLSTGEGDLEIFGETPVAIEPGKGYFDHLSAEEDFKTGRIVGTLVDLRRSTDQVWQGRGEASHRRRPRRRTDGAARERGHGSFRLPAPPHHDLARRQHGLRRRRAGWWCRSRYDVCDPQPSLGQALDLFAGHPPGRGLPRPRTGSTARPAALGGFD